MQKVDISAPEHLKDMLDLCVVKAANIARCIGISKSALSRTFSGSNQSLIIERGLTVAELLRLNLDRPSNRASLAKRTYIWGITTTAKREALPRAIGAWLGVAADLISHPVLPQTPMPGWTFILLKTRKKKLRQGGVGGSPAVLLAIRDEALERLPARLEGLPLMEGPIYEITKERVEAAWDLESTVPGPKRGNTSRNRTENADVDNDTLLVEKERGSIDRQVLFHYLLRCRTALGVDTSAVESLAQPPAVRASLFPEQNDSGSSDPDEMEEVLASGLRDRLDRSRTGQGAWQVLAYEPGFHPGPWLAIGGIAIDQALLPANFQAAANSGALRIIRYADASAYFVEMAARPWPRSAAIEAAEGSYLLETACDDGAASYQIANLRREKEFLVWPIGEPEAIMHYDEELYGNADTRPDGLRFRILGRVIGRLNFFSAS